MPYDLFIPPYPAPPSHPLPYPLPLTGADLSGFPSPAQDYESRTLDLNERLVKRYELPGNRPFLMSGNAHYPPIPAAGLECQACGVLWGAIK